MQIGVWDSKEEKNLFDVSVIPFKEREYFNCLENKPGSSKYYLINNSGIDGSEQIICYYLKYEIYENQDYEVFKSPKYLNIDKFFESWEIFVKAVNSHNFEIAEVIKNDLIEFKNIGITKHQVFISEIFDATKEYADQYLKKSPLEFKSIKYRDSNWYNERYINLIGLEFDKKTKILGRKDDSKVVVETFKQVIRELSTHRNPEKKIGLLISYYYGLACNYLKKSHLDLALLCAFKTTESLIFFHGLSNRVVGLDAGRITVDGRDPREPLIISVYEKLVSESVWIKNDELRTFLERINRSRNTNKIIHGLFHSEMHEVSSLLQETKKYINQTIESEKKIITNAESLSREIKIKNVDVFDFDDNYQNYYEQK